MERKKSSPNGVNSNVQYDTFNGENGTGESNKTYSIEEAVEAAGFGKFQIILSLVAGFAWIADSMEIMVLSIIGPVLSCEWNLSSIEESLITVVVFTGFMIGAPAFGMFADKYGRKKSLVFGCAWALCYGVMSAFAPNYGWMLALRALTGIGIAGVPQVVTYYSEFLPSSSRGKCIILIQIFWAIGGMLEVVLALLILLPFGWRPWLAVSAVPMLLFIPMILPMPESPRYCLIAGRYVEAVESIETVAKFNKASLPAGKLEETIKVKRGQVKDLLVPSFRLTTVLVWIMWFCGAFCYYGLVLLCTELVRIGTTCPTTDTGIGEAACSAECESLDYDDYVTLLWTATSEVPGLMITAIFVDLVGRKTLLITEFSVFAVTVMMLFICQVGPALIFTLYLARALAASAFQVCYVYTPEVYPTSSRAVGMGWACAFARLGAIVTPFVAQVLLGVSVKGCAAVYAGAGVVAAITVALLPIETKGRDMGNTVSQN